MLRFLSLLVASALAAPAAAQLPPPPAPLGNPITPEKAVLGKILFFDEQLSSDNTVACATCHISSAGGSDPRIDATTRHPGIDGVFGTDDDLIGSPGVILQDALEDFQISAFFGLEPQVTPRNTPSHIGAQYFGDMFWDGRASTVFEDPDTGFPIIPFGGSLESQAAGPPLSDVEMAHEGRSWSQITTKLETCVPLKLASNLTPDIVTALGLHPDYPSLFQSAFGTPDITATRIAFALATFERTLVPDQTPWDSFNQGNTNALTQNQRDGLQIFTGFLNCSQCHQPPLFSDGSFRNIGLRRIAEDPGRFNVTGDPADRGKFKVPSLRNVGLRPRYFHNGEADTITEVITFYGSGGVFLDNIDPLLVPFAPPLFEPQLTDFLANGLTDPRVANELPPFDRPQLHSELSPANPRPVGSGIAGSGGFTPQIIANSPPNLGNQSFKIGIAGGLGGARAHLVIFEDERAMAFAPARLLAGGVMPRASARLEGTGPGGGYATVHFPIPDDGSLTGKTVLARWFIADPAAPGGFASTAFVEIEVF